MANQDGGIKDILRDYVATANNKKYAGNWDVINSKFPELKSYDKQLLKDYVATANNKKYGGDWNTINSKFPEFSVKKKDVPAASQTTVAPSTPGLETSQATQAPPSIIPGSVQADPGLAAEQGLQGLQDIQAGAGGGFTGQVSQGVSSAAAPGRQATGQGFQLGTVFTPKPTYAPGVETFGQVPQAGGQQQMLTEDLKQSAVQTISEIEQAKQAQIDAIPDDFTAEERKKAVQTISKDFDPQIKLEQDRIKDFDVESEQALKTTFEKEIVNKDIEEKERVAAEKESMTESLTAPGSMALKQIDILSKRPEQSNEEALGFYGGLVGKDLDEWAKIAGEEVSDADLADIKTYQKFTEKTLNSDLTEEEKLISLGEEYKRLQAKMDASNDEKQLNYEAAVKGKDVKDILYEKKDQMVQDGLMDGLPDEMREFTNDIWTQTSEMRDFMSEFYDPTGKKGFTVRDGKIDISGITDPKKLEYLTNRANQLKSGYDKMMRDKYAEYEDELQPKRIALSKMNDRIAEAERVFSSLSKDDPRYDEYKKAIDNAKLDLDKSNAEIEEADMWKSAVFLTEPKKLVDGLSDSFGDSDSAKAAFSSQIPGLSPFENFERSYLRLKEETERMRQEGDFDAGALDQIGQNVRSFLDWGGYMSLSEEEKEYFSNRRILNSLTPIFLNNNTGITETDAGFFEAFWSGASSFMTPETSDRHMTQTKVLADVSNYMSENGFEADQFRSAEFTDEIADRIEEIPWYSSESVGEMTGVVAAVITDLTISNALVLNPALKLANKNELFVRLGNAYDKTMDATKFGRFMKAPIEQAVRFESAGRVVGSSESELDWKSGLAGAMAGDLVKGIFSKIPTDKLYDWTKSIFGNSADDVVAVFDKAGKAAARGKGEVAEETAETLVQIYNDELRERGFWDEVSANFGSYNDNMKFFLSSFMMGAGFSFSQPAKAKQAYDSLTDEQKAEVDRVKDGIAADITEATQSTAVEAEKIKDNEASVKATEAKEKEIAETKEPAIEGEEGAEVKTEGEAGEQVIAKSSFGDQARVEPETEADLTDAQKEIAESFPYIDGPAEKIGEGQFGEAFLVSDKDGNMSVVKKTKSLPESWLGEMQQVNPHKDVAVINEVKTGEGKFNYLISKEYLNTEGLPGDNVWDLVEKWKISPTSTTKKAKETLSLQDNNLFQDITGKIESIESHFGTTIDTKKDNWGYDGDGKLKLFDLDGGTTKKQYEDFIGSTEASAKAEDVVVDEDGTVIPQGTEQVVGVESKEETPDLSPKLEGKTLKTKAESTGKVSKYQKDFLKKIKATTSAQAIKKRILEGTRFSKEEVTKETGFGAVIGAEKKIVGKSEIGKRKNLYSLDPEKVTSIDDLALSLKEEYPELYARIDTPEIRSEIIEILTSNETIDDIAMSLRDEYSVDGTIYESDNDRMAAAQYEYNANKYGDLETPEVVTDEEVDALSEEELAEMDASEKEYIESLSDEEIKERFEGPDTKGEAVTDDTKGESKDADEQGEAGEELAKAEEQERVDKESFKEQASKLGHDSKDVDSFASMAYDTNKSVEENVKDFVEFEEQAAKNDAEAKAEKGEIDFDEGTEFKDFESAVTKGSKAALDWLDDLDQKLSDFGKETLGMNLPVAVAQIAVKAAKVAVKAGGTVAEAIDAAIDSVKKSDWYNKEATEEQKAAVEQSTRDIFSKPVEKPAAKKKPAPKKKDTDSTPKEKVSKQTKRAAELEEDPKIKKKLESIGKYKVQNQEQVSRYVDDLIDTLGSEGAIEYANTDNVNPDMATAVKTEAGARTVRDARAEEKQARKDGDEDAIFAAQQKALRGLDAINNASLQKTKIGQVISYTKKTYAKYPEVFLIDKMRSFEGANKGDLENEYATDEEGNAISAEEAIQDVQEGISSQIDDVVSKKMDEILSELEQEKGKVQDLNKEIDRLKKERDAKIGTKKERVKRAQSKRSKAIDKLKSGKNSGEISMTILGLNNTQVEAIFDIIASYIEEGYHRSDIILTKTLSDVRSALGNKNVTKDHIRNMAEQIDGFNAMVQGELERGDFDAKDALTGKDLKKIVRQHYKGRNAYARSLAQAIVASTGMDVDSAEAIASAIESKLKNEIEALVKKELDKMLMADRETMADLLKAKKDGTITENQEIELQKKLDSKENRGIQAKIVKAINMGALQRGTDIQKAFENKFGFRSLPDSVKNRLNDIAARIADLEMDAEKDILNEKGEVVGKIDTRHTEAIGRLQKEFNTLLESQNKVNTAIVLKEIVSLQYIAMLSGAKTFARAFIGGYGSGFFGTMVYNIANIANARSLAVGYRAMAKSIPAAWSRARTARKTGYDFFGENAMKGDYNSASQGRVERALFTGLGDAINSGNVPKVILKTVGQTLKVIHALGALDTFMNTLSGNFVGATEEAKVQRRKNNKNPSMNQTVAKMLEDKSLREADYRDIAAEEWKNIEADIKADVDAEIKAGILKESKRDSEVNKRLKDEVGVRGSYVSPGKTYKTRRVQELRENDMGRRFEEGVALSKDASLMGKPDGIAGLGVQSLQGGMNIKPGDNGAVAMGKFMLNMIFKFTRITGSVINKSMNNIPVLGIANSMLGPGFDPVTGEWDTSILGKAKANPMLMKQRIATNLITTALIFAAMIEMFEFGDEDDDNLERLKNLIDPKKWKLDPNRRMDIRGFGFGGMGGSSKNKRLHEGWENISFSFDKDDDGNFTNYKTLRLVPELATIAATTGVFTDDFKGDASKDDIWSRMDSPVGSYLGRGLSNNMKIFTESSFSSIGRIAKNFTMKDDVFEGAVESGKELLTDNIRPLVNPAVASSTTRYIQAAMQVDQKGGNDFISKLIRGAYGLDYFLKNERTDIFGNPYPVENDPESFIYELQEKRSEKFEKTTGLLYKFDKGLDVTKWKVKDYERGGTFKVKGSSKLYRSMNSDIADEILKVQEDEFKRLILRDHSRLNSIDDRDKLEKAVKKLQTRSKNYAEREMREKYLESGEIVVVEDEK